MKQIKMKSHLYGRIIGAGARVKNKENFLYLVSKNDDGILTRAELVQYNICSPRVSDNHIHFFYARLARHGDAPSCYIYVSKHMNIEPASLNKGILFFYFNPATSSFSVYNKNKFEPVVITLAEESCNISITRELYQKIHKLKDKYVTMCDNPKVLFPKVYMLAKDKNDALVKMEEIPVDTNFGCEEMLRLHNHSIYQTYITLGRQGLIPCGYLSYTTVNVSARTFEHFFEGSEIFLNVGLFYPDIRVYDTKEDSGVVRPIKFKITET